jgi:hypothetical protein
MCKNCILCENLKGCLRRYIVALISSDTLPLNRQADIVTTMAGIYRALCSA